jgi:hypothetical protein
VNEIVYKYDAKESSANSQGGHELRTQIETMTKIQDEMIKEDMEDDDHSKVEVKYSDRRNLSKSTTLAPDMRS